MKFNRWSDFHRHRKYLKRLRRRWSDRVSMHKWTYYLKLQPMDDDAGPW